ncbi:MAG: ABC transporter permease subunit [Ancalomicrobiaceae bacterium]|nr:ABC transporter permease subunit [Ancalomicrobiaceae bacterium]
MSRSSAFALLLVAPALALVAVFFLHPLVLSVMSAFMANGQGPTLANFSRAFELYSGDIIFTIFVVTSATILTLVVAIAIAGALTLSASASFIAALRFLYRWPLFVPFIVAAQCMRTFLARNGLMNNAFVALGLFDPTTTSGYLDWRGMVITFAWKQVPFVTLLIAGAMASLDRATIEAGRDLGASRLRVLVELVIPQVMPTLLVSATLSFVLMLSVLSVPMMVAGTQPTLITVDMAFRINAYGDYGTANALGVISYLLASGAAIFYLRHTLKDDRR